MTLLYAFGDYASPTTDLMEVWASMYDTVYLNEFEFHKDIALTLHSLGDANTLYTIPAEYNSYRVFRPLAFNIVHSDTDTSLNTLWTTMNTYVGLNDTQYQALCGCSLLLSTFYNRPIQSVNGIDPFQFILTWTNVTSKYRSLGSRFNDGLGPAGKVAQFNIEFIDFAPEVESITFADDNRTVSFSLGVIVYNNINQSDSTTKPGQRLEDPSVAPPVAPMPPNVGVMNSSLPQGNVSSFLVQATYPGILYATYKGTAVLKIGSFDPLLNDDIGWSRVVQDATAAISNGPQSLILDLAHSRGDSTCLAYWLMSVLVKPWGSAPLEGTDILYSPWDFKKSRTTDALEHSGIITASQYFNPSTGHAAASNWYTSSQFYLRGGVTSAYTDKLFNAGCSDVLNRLPPVKSWFNKILILTDGRCIGACAQLVTKLRISDRVRIILYGGVATSTVNNRDIDPAPNAGGSVFDWQQWVSSVVNPTAGLPLLPTLPTSASLRFVFNEMYSNIDDPSPREFTPAKAVDFFIDTWDPFDGTLQSEVNLYEAALGYLEKVPDGLPTNQQSPEWLTPLTLAVIVIAAIVVVVIAVGVTVCLYKRIGFNYQMIEQKSGVVAINQATDSDSSDSD